MAHDMMSGTWVLIGLNKLQPLLGWSRSKQRPQGGLVAAAAGVALLLAGCGSDPALVVYTSQDRVYSEPILKRFTEETGIEVNAVYDSEAVKTVGLANRLLAEKNNPICDVFWNNEELRTRQLALLGVLETKGWASIGYRSRRIVYNTNRVTVAEIRNFSSVTNEIWKGRFALAYPLFGTTATHVMALRDAWGEAKWEGWLRRVQENEPLVVDGNSVVVRLVGAGEADIGFTDSDDIEAGLREGLPIAAAPLNEETLLIANTASVVTGAQRPEEARRFIEFLKSEPVVRAMMDADALEGASKENVSVEPLDPNWEAVLQNMPSAVETLRQIFLRE